MENEHRVGLVEAPHDIFERSYNLIKNRTEEAKYPICIQSVNDITHGYPPGPTVISARTGHCKTAFMLQNAMYHSCCGLNVMYLSLEDTKESLVEKAMCQMMKYDNQAMKKGRTGLIDLEQCVKFFEAANIYFDDGYGFNFNEIKEAYGDVRFKDNKKADVIYWDYIQMIDEADFKTYNNIMRAIRRFSIKARIPFIIGCQQNRQSTMMGEPSNATTKGSGTIEEVAEMIILLNYPYQLGCEKGRYKEGDNEREFIDLCPEEKRLVWQSYIEISISKNKTGPTYPKKPVEYYGKHYYFRDWSTPVSIIQNHKLGFNNL